MPTKKKLDYKKEFPDLYKPSLKEPTIIKIPKMMFFMIDGTGDPNTSDEYKEVVQLLYNISYALKMKVIKKETPSKDYVVPPLEGLWYMPKMEEWSMDEKDKWEWTMMIRIPDFVKDSQIKKAMKILKETKNPDSFSKLRYEQYDEGTCVQIMYLGPYDEEPPTIKKIHQFAKKNGYNLNGHHHEIYLSDPRRVEPERLKTILRHPIIKI
ncbi:MAG: GyrI-like domain-containing protein [Promethearchaeota archaeon]